MPTTTGSPHLGRLPRERASDAIYKILLDCISTRVFQPGERLDMKDLARKFDVSPTPIKDALNRLTAQGFIEIRPRKGTYVADLSMEDVVETFEIREALECLAAEKLVDRVTQDGVEKFRQLIAELEKAVKDERDRFVHEQKNEAFHNLIVDLAGNKKLKEMYRGLKAHIKMVRVHYLSRNNWVDRIEGEERAEHRRIFKAIEARDGAQLVQALRQHIRRASECLVEDLRSRRDAAAGE